MNSPNSFTGVDRAKTAKTHVKLIDALAQGIVTVGGFGTIAAVLLVCCYLAYVAKDLFYAGEYHPDTPHAIPAEPVVATAVDEYRRLYWVVDEQGQASLRQVSDGSEIFRRPVFEAGEVTAWSHGVLDGAMTAGFADGTVRIGDFGFSYEFVPADSHAGLADLPEGAFVLTDDGLIECTGHEQYRKTTLAWDFGDSVSMDPDGRPVRLVNHISSPDKRFVASYHEGGRLALGELRVSKISGAWRLKGRIGSVDVAERITTPPVGMQLTGLGDNCFLVWPDGSLLRYQTRDLSTMEMVESIDALPPGRRLVSFGPVAGRNTMLLGDDAGVVHAWFRARPDDAPTVDGEVLIKGHEYHVADGEPIVAMTPSPRSRLIAFGTGSGRVQIRNASNEAVIIDAEPAVDGPIRHMSITPKENGLLILGERQAAVARMDPLHHDVSLGGIATPTHYEGYEHPQHRWQSTGGNASEPKLSLWPLVFGTLKGTFISMLFAVPVALLAAIYTSEFMNKKVKSTVKPAIEMMASLPSVVLGFLAAAYFALLFEENIVAIVISLYLVPLVFMLGAQVWQLLPRAITGRVPWMKVVVIFVLLLLTPVLAMGLSDGFERLFFAVAFVESDGSANVSYDFVKWLNAGTGPAIGEIPPGMPFSGLVPVEQGNSQVLTTAFGGWFLAMIPVVGVLVFLLHVVLIKPRLMIKTADWDTARLAVFALVNFLILTLITLLGAMAVAMLLSYIGDMRSSLLGTFQQRNALVVGFVMGFAVIPIIYTIAEDALTAVPDSLRMASLGAGATPWQTAVRIVLPTAMSGVFSAIMVGLGRCVGETMIVLMATGNTPITDVNLFNGFRTLSANIAVELPEAVRGDAHYRLLFLSGLVLFAMTFVFNTLAEAVRQRFRKKAMQL